jgi:hypothetical protein
MRIEFRRYQRPQGYVSSFALERIRPPKREQVQFLFLSLGCCTAAVQQLYAPPKGRSVLNLHIIFDESASFCHMVGQQSRDACILRRSAGQDWKIRTEPVPFSEVAYNYRLNHEVKYNWGSFSWIYWSCLQGMRIRPPSTVLSTQSMFHV